MIHILTVHWKSDQWIDIQLKYLKHFIKEPYQVYAFLNQVPKANLHKEKYFYCSTENIRQHPIKLNLLADMACFSAKNEDDFLMFIDGDAFPVNDITEFKNTVMQNTNLAAIQRLDNSGDIQPHPCFCMTKVKYWKEIKGDWKPGNVTWKNHLNVDVQDLGGKLMSILDQRNETWIKLNRSNINSQHPVLFGIYGDLIYHHGAGFRTPGIRSDKINIKNYKFKLAVFEFMRKIIPFQLARKLFFPMNASIKVNQKNSDEIVTLIHNDFYFYKKLNQ